MDCNNCNFKENGDCFMLDLSFEVCPVNKKTRDEIYNHFKTKKLNEFLGDEFISYLKKKGEDIEDKRKSSVED